ncbi:MAG TPA: TerC family protein [Tepidisphaeraceae bacterium]|nr:TerC family protein [Tepidisphaeraceae bacterium]
MLIWAVFVGFILLLLAVDLGVLNRRPHAVSTKEAMSWSAVWVAMALAFGAVVYLGHEHQWMGFGTRPDPVDGHVNDGPRALIKYLTGYLIEKSLSVDNLFVIALIFTSMGIPSEHQHRVLHWGVLGALVMRGAMIGLGAELIARHHWVLYVFGGFLLVTAGRMLFMGKRGATAGRQGTARLLRRWLPVTEQMHGPKFAVRQAGKWMVTPLALALLMVESTDAIFAVDSIPAIFAITADPFLVFASNVFAILGLRSLYFVLAGMIQRFSYLKVALALVLALVGAKMLAAHWLRYWIGPGLDFYLLGLAVLILAAGVLASLWATRPTNAKMALVPETPRD